MPIVKLITHAREEGTMVINCAFEDEDDNSVSPQTMYWTLSDTDGTIINSREDEEVSSPAASEDIVLTGDDLAFQSDEEIGAVRILLVYGTYNSSAGNGLNFKKSAQFTIDDILKV